MGNWQVCVVMIGVLGARGLSKKRAVIAFLWKVQVKVHGLEVASVASHESNPNTTLFL